MSVMVKECRLLELFLRFSILPSAAQSVIFLLYVLIIHSALSGGVLLLLLTAQWKLCNSMIEDTFMYDEDETYLMMKVHGEAVLKERG